MRSRMVLPALLVGAAILSFAGCDGSDEVPVPDPVDPKALQIAVQRGTGIDPALHAGTFAMKIPADLPIGEVTLPIMVYGGFSEQSETRLRMNAFVDLRAVQARLPELASGALHETCKHEISLNLIETVADGDLIRASGTVRAKIFSCNRRDPENEKQGIRWLTQDVNVEATAKATVAGQCIRFALVDLQLDPRGLLGGVANLFGLTDIARSAILEKAEEFFAENPVCPKVPSELSTLSPEFNAGGVREIGDRGIGASLSGSVDTSASTMISLLAVMEQRDIVEGDK